LIVSARKELVPGGSIASAPQYHVTRRIPSKETNELRTILSTFTSSSNLVRHQYGCDLEKSLNALEMTSSLSKLPNTTPNVISVARGIKEIRTMLTNHFAQIRNALSADDSRFQWLDLGNLWPCNTSMAMLEQLRSSSGHKFGSHVKEAIVSHGILVTTLQRLLRIHTALYEAQSSRLHEELGNSGHENWDPLGFPDWLLLEIDSNILIRNDQIDVAHAIISPRSKDNTVLQLNMGKGEPSVAATRYSIF